MQGERLGPWRESGGDDVSRLTVTHHNDGRPRGTISLSDRVRSAVRLVREGQPRTAVAALYGVKVVTVTDWVRQVAEWAWVAANLTKEPVASR